MTKSEFLLCILQTKAPLVKSPDGTGHICMTDFNIYKEEARAYVLLDKANVSCYDISLLVPYFYKLEDISQKDMIEFNLTFELDLLIEKHFIFDNEKIYLEDQYGIRSLSTKEIVWLMSKGYYVGQVSSNSWEVRIRKEEN